MRIILNNTFQLQSGVDADARYDAVRGKISSLFAPLITLTSKYVHLIGIDEMPSCDRMTFFSSSLLLMINIWTLRTIEKTKLREILSQMSTESQHSLIMVLLATQTTYRFRPEAILEREKKLKNQGKQNMDKLSELNKGHQSAISMLRQPHSLPRSTSLIETNISGTSSVRSWKQVRTRGLTNTTSFANDLPIQPVKEAGADMVNIDLDISTEVTHSILDMLDELNQLELDGQCQYDVCLLLTELILTPQSSGKGALF